MVNNILMSLEENPLAFYFHTLHITQQWSIGLKGSRGFDSIMEIDPCFIDPLKRLSRILKFEQLSFSRCYSYYFFSFFLIFTHTPDQRRLPNTHDPGH